MAPAWPEQVFSTVVSWREADGLPVSFYRVGNDDLSAWLAAPSSGQEGKLLTRRSDD
jgi:hypothetical protein